MLCVGFSLWELRLSRSTGSRHSGFSRSQHPRVGPGREGRGAAPEWVSSPRPCQWRHPQQHAGPHLWELGHLFGLLSFGTFFFLIMSRRLLVLELQGGMGSTATQVRHEIPRTVSPRAQGLEGSSEATGASAAPPLAPVPTALSPSPFTSVQSPVSCSP